MTSSIVAITLGIAITSVMLIARKPAVAAGAMALCLGASLGCAVACQNLMEVQQRDNGQIYEVDVTLIEDSRSTSAGETAFVSLSLEDGTVVKALAELGDIAPVLHGAKARVSGTWVNPDWNRDEYLWLNGAIGRLHVSAFEEIEPNTPLSILAYARRRAIDSIGDADDARALLQAIVCGYRHSIAATSLYSRFQACGLAHLVAVSGAHLVIVTGLFAVALKALHVSKRITVTALVMIMASYLAFSGAPISAIRATVMTSIGMFSVFGNRRPSAQNALGIGIFAIILLSPSSAVSISFALSALSTAGIVLYAPLFAFWINSSPLASIPFVSDALSMTLASNLLSQLYACSVFNILPIVGPLANVACAPLFPLVCAWGLAAALAGVAGLVVASPVLDAALLVTSMLGEIVRALASLPYSSIPISIDTPAALMLSSFVALVLWMLWPRIKARHVAIAISCVIPVFMAFSFLVSQEDAIVMLDVGQGDSFLVRSRGSTLLIDTGNRDSQLVEQLARCTVIKLDSVLLTHSDDDHVGSLDAIAKSVHVDHVIVASDMISSADSKNEQLVLQAHQASNDVVGVMAGDVFTVGAFTVHVIWPHAFLEEGGNADSVCLFLEYDGDQDGVIDFKALFTGDAEEPQIKTILNERDIGDIDVLKVGHHGSKNGMSLSQLESLDPEIALIGVGSGNRYGHPAEETLDMLSSIGCKVYRSDLDGQVKCRFSADAIRVGIQYPHVQH